jgi:fucose permease
MRSNLMQNRRLIFYMLYLAYICVGIIGILPGPTLPLLAAHTGVSLDVVGWIFTSSATGFMCGVAFAGIISAKFGPKPVVLSGLAIMAISGLVTARANLFSLLLATQFVQGIGFGFLDVSINMTVTLVFADTLGETFNNLHSAYGIGALVAPLLLSLALQITHDAFFAYLIGSLVGAASIFLLVGQPIPSVPKEKLKEKPKEKKQRQKTITTVSSSVLRQPLLWLMALQMGLYVGAEVGFGNWIVTAVSQSAVISLALAAPCATFLWLGLTMGRLIGAQALKRRLVSENVLLYISVLGSSISGLVVALFLGHILISFTASALVGFFFGPIFPGIMAMASRWFVHTIDTVSSVLLISAGAAGMVLPVLMGILIPHIGINWVMAMPALACLSVIVPLSLALRRQRHMLQSQSNMHTMDPEVPMPGIKE